jgi:beta-hydroxylase
MPNCVLIVLIVLVGLAVFLVGNAEKDRQKGHVRLDARSYYTTPELVLLSPYNNCIGWLSTHGQSPFLDWRRVAPHLAAFVAHWHDIRTEAQRVVTRPVADLSQATFGGIGRPSWTAFILKWYHTECEPGAADKCPTTCALLDNDRTVLSAMFSVMGPRTHIKRHAGPFRGCVRAHLGLSVPRQSDECYIQVDGRRYSWSAGELQLFDDTYVHEVHNNTDEPRIVLFMDVLRPLSSRAARSVNERLVRSRLPRILTKINSKNEKPGTHNHEPQPAS